MAGWAGFSDEELRKLQQKDLVGFMASGRGRKQATTNRSRQQLQRERALQVGSQQKAGQKVLVLLPEQRLYQPPPQTVDRVADQVHVHAPASAPVTAKKLSETLEMERMVSSNASVAVKETPIAKELEKDEVEVREKTRLECLQKEQKLIEERNKRKKALLTKTIAEKSKQTQAETVKLKRIQKEVQALDDMVSNDIGILRGKIEQASWDYNAARKRYEKAEAEYVTAKLDLHKKTDIKEQLTEHLFAIIQQNELRKALKLEELMQQLQLQATEEEPERKREEEEEPENVKRVVEVNGEGVEADQAASENITPGLEAKTLELGVALVHKDDLSLTDQKTSNQDCIMLDTSSQEQRSAEFSPCTS